jgi:two-component system, LuxR family, sensor kinase FixL
MVALARRHWRAHVRNSTDMTPAASERDPHSSLSWRLLRNAALFAPAYIVLDWASYVYPLGPFYITPWNPQPALAVVLVMLGGIANSFSVFGAIFLADLAIRGAPGGYPISILGSLILACGYSAIGAILRRRVRDAGLRVLHDLAVFTVVVCVATAVVGFAYVALLKATDQLTGTSFMRGWIRFWVGDLVGIVVTAPLMLAAADGERRRTLVAMARSPEAWLQVAMLVAVVWTMFAVYRENAARLFYLLFIPLIWTSLRWGMAGAIVAATVAQVGVLAGMESRATILPILELQALVAAFTITGLFLGVTLDERRASEERLSQSMRLAAAGEMAGAIAHELNQPLTALAAYGESAQKLLDAGADPAQTRDVLEKMLRDVRRTGEVTARLRDLFRSGTTRLEAVTAQELAATARRIGESVIRTAPIRLDVEQRSGAIPTLYIDRVQVELVLRNLFANSVESLQAAKTPQPAIRVTLAPRGDDMVLLTVGDNGPGIPASVRPRLFQPFASGKAVGMGMGLAVSRAIAEAHGGSLDAADTPHGEFHLVLPCLPTA